LDKRLQIWQGLKRIKNTETQTRLSKAARKSNVRGAFRVSKKEVPERVVLVDDVMTTGATLDACARVLKRSGVLEVITLTVARG
jgi:predicted amidophosphoribosyltransferase